MREIRLMAILFAVAFVSCKKEKSASEKLMAHTWQLKEKYENNIETTRPCEEDNIHSFKGAGEYMLQTGNNPCYIGEDANYTGMWEINPEQTRMNVVYTGNNMTYNIVSLSEGQLEVTYDVDTVNVREIYR